jgi:CheY-like chemotaxis protein
VRAGELKFLLELRGPYAVTVVAGSVEALQVLQLFRFDLLLAELRPGPGMDANELALAAKGADADLPVILFSHTVSSYDRASHANAFMPKGACSSLEMLERMHVLTIRKRGPKKAGRVLREAAL